MLYKQEEVMESLAANYGQLGCRYLPTINFPFFQSSQVIKSFQVNLKSVNINCQSNHPLNRNLFLSSNLFSKIN